MSERARPSAPTLTKIILAVLLVALYLPLVVVVFASFSKVVDGVRFFTLEWYKNLFADETLTMALARSLIVAVINGLVATLMGTIGAVAISVLNFKSSKLLAGLSGLSLAVPELVFALSLLTLFNLLGFELGLTTVVIAHVTFTISFVMLTVQARADTLDRRLELAAKDLGASNFEVLIKITLPLLKPAVLTGFLLALLLSFDDFLITFYTNGAGGDTLPIKLYSHMKYGVSPKIHALAVIMLCTSLLLVLVLSRRTRFISNST